MLQLFFGHYQRNQALTVLFCFVITLQLFFPTGAVEDLCQKAEAYADAQPAEVGEADFDQAFALNEAEREIEVLLAESGSLEKHHYRSLAFYQVKPGDSLYWIAASYGISTQELRQLNDLDSDVIHPGQTLSVPLDHVKYYSAGLRLSDQEVEWLAQMIYAEARGEPFSGQVAVGAVIINRVLSPLFPNTLRGVLFQENAFQPVGNGSFYLTPNDSAKRAALEALNGSDPTGGALYFFNPRQSTDGFMHSRPAKTTIGSHRFTN